MVKKVVAKKAEVKKVVSVLPEEPVFEVSYPYGGTWVSQISNVIVTLQQGRDPDTTAWSIAFDVRNKAWAENEPLWIDFYTADGGPIPVPNIPVVVHGWINACYKAPHNRIVFDDGLIRVPFADLAELVHHVRFRHGYIHVLGSC